MTTSRFSRPYAGIADLRRMQAAVARAYRITSLRVGDLAWLTRYHTHRELSLDIRLWEDGRRRLLGWTFFRAFGGFNIFVAPGVADDALLDEMLNEVVGAAGASVAAGDPPVSLYTYGLDLSRSPEDRALAAALERNGFRQAPSPSGVMTRSLHQLPDPVLPTGYELGWVQTRAQMLGRVEAQRAAFAPSDFLVERYERVRRTWPYRADLDRVVLSEHDVVVAFCTAWLDDENAAGLLEPVGTDPAHRRRGLAGAVCIDALRSLREAGATVAQVGFGSDAAYATYRSIGFELSATDLSYRRDPD
jgi:ribosomal protein S18 acetylase RimI-like enzyme